MKTGKSTHTTKKQMRKKVSQVTRPFILLVLATNRRKEKEGLVKDCFCLNIEEDRSFRGTRGMGIGRTRT